MQKPFSMTEVWRVGDGERDRRENCYTFISIPTNLYSLCALSVAMSETIAKATFVRELA